MLVYFHKGFLMEGTNSKKVKKHFWSKPEFIKQTIYCTTGINGVCDDSELEAEVERLTKKELDSDGWGYKFDRWHRVVPYLESLEIAKRDKWEADYPIPKNEIKTEPVDEWPMEKIIKELTGKQFAQFCRENNIPMQELK